MTSVTLLVLFILHHALNIGWRRSLTRGRYTPERILLMVTDVLLTAAMLTVAVSALLVSLHVFDFLGLKIRALGRRIHMPAMMWFFVFMSLHLGLHLPAMIATLRRRHPWMQTTIPDKYAMERMGYSTPATLKKVYQHTMSGKRAEVNNMINNHMDETFTGIASATENEASA